MNSFITIIVPIYKTEKHLRACLDSILSQTYREYELILIDDGSPDGCGSICEEYALLDDRIRAFHQENQGIAMVRNAGISKALGEYILFVDSDDTIQPELLEEAVEAAERHDSDMVIFHYRALDEDGNLLYTAKIDLPAGLPFNLQDNPQLLLTPTSLSNKLIKKKLFTDIYFPPGIWYEDLWMTPKLYTRSDKIVYLGRKPLYNYFIHQGSIMRSGNLNKLYQDRLTVLKNLLSYFKAQNLFDKYKDELEALTALHGFFYASLETLQVEKNLTQLNNFRKFVESEFDQFNKNIYIRKLGRKERLQFGLLFHKQYSLIMAFSYFKKALRRVKKDSVM